jgi:hypothetical protein
MSHPFAFKILQDAEENKRKPCNGKQVGQQIVNRKQIAGEHEDNGAHKRAFFRGLRVLQKEVNRNTRQKKMEDDQPVPDNIEGEEQIENVRGIKHTGLQCREKRYAAVLVGVPKWECPALEKADPQHLWGDKESGQVTLDKDLTTR